jgi:hypothetical protein
VQGKGPGDMTDLDGQFLVNAKIQPFEKK